MGFGSQLKVGSVDGRDHHDKPVSQKKGDIVVAPGSSTYQSNSQMALDSGTINEAQKHGSTEGDRPPATKLIPQSMGAAPCPYSSTHENDPDRQEHEGLLVPTGLRGQSFAPASLLKQASVTVGPHRDKGILASPRKQASEIEVEARRKRRRRGGKKNRRKGQSNGGAETGGRAMARNNVSSRDVPIVREW